MHEVRQIVVEVRESDPVLCPDRLPDDDLVDVVELVPIVIQGSRILDQRLVFRTPGNSDVQCLSGEEGLQVEQVEVVVVDQVSHQLKMTS